MKKSIAGALIVFVLTVGGGPLLIRARAAAPSAPLGGEFHFIFSAEQYLAHANAILKSRPGDNFYGHKQRAMELIAQASHELRAGVGEVRRKRPAPGAPLNEGATATAPPKNYRLTSAPGDPGEFTYIYEAMHKLQDAQLILVKEAQGGFYGHKRNAIDQIGEAMEQLHDGMEEYRAKGPSHPTTGPVTGAHPRPAP